MRITLKLISDRVHFIADIYTAPLQYYLLRNAPDSTSSKERSSG